MAHLVPPGLEGGRRLWNFSVLPDVSHHNTCTHQHSRNKFTSCSSWLDGWKSFLQNLPRYFGADLVEAGPKKLKNLLLWQNGPQHCPQKCVKLYV